MRRAVSDGLLDVTPVEGLVSLSPRRKPALTWLEPPQVARILRFASDYGPALAPRFARSASAAA